LSNVLHYFFGCSEGNARRRSICSDRTSCTESTPDTLVLTSAAAIFVRVDTLHRGAAGCNHRCMCSVISHVLQLRLVLSDIATHP